MRITDTARIAASRLVLDLLARTGDPFAQVLAPRAGTDVYAVHERMRARGPVHRSRSGVLVVTAHALCSDVLRDPRFRVRDAAGRPADFDPLSPQLSGALDGSFLEQDPPDHTRLRRLVAPAFRPRLVRDQRSPIATRVDALLDTAAARGSFDLIADLAGPLPIRVITDLLGIPDVDTARFARYGAIVGQSLGGIFSQAEADELRAATDDLAALFARLERQRRDARSDGVLSDDVISLLSGARAASELTMDELVATCGLLLVAGFETTVNLIGNAVLALAAHPDQWASLHADPGLADAAVEETLRYDPPVQLTVRVAAEPVRLADVDVRAGERVALVLGAAGRDRTVYGADADRFDLTRAPAADHLAFGSGIHYCLGAPLARLEASIALAALAKRLPELRITGPVRRRPGGAIRGCATLPLSPPAGSPVRPDPPAAPSASLRP